MKQPNPVTVRWALGLAGALALCGLAFLIVRSAGSGDSDTPVRVSFQISTGSTSGTYFPVGEFLAGLLSHPPGIGRCETENVCAPAGLIVNTRTSEGSIANVMSVNSGSANSGLAQADVVDMAVKGEGPFRKAGPAKNLRTIANLYGEDVHLIAANDAKILNVSDLRGKRVSISSEGSGTIVTARAVLRAYRLTERRIIPNYDTVDKAAELFREGKLDAMFFVGGSPVTLVEQLLEQGVGVLIPIDGAGRDRLLKAEPYLSSHTIPQGIYAGTPPIDTVAMGALWITHDEQPEDLIYGMVKALYNPQNRDLINERGFGFDFLNVKNATSDAIAPLHAGALKFYREAGVAPPDS
jgi:TRAP transporter TAXI family solute receptor